MSRFTHFVELRANILSVNISIKNKIRELSISLMNLWHVSWFPWQIKIIFIEDCQTCVSKSHAILFLTCRMTCTICFCMSIDVQPILLFCVCMHVKRPVTSKRFVRNKHWMWEILQGHLFTLKHFMISKWFKTYHTEWQISDVSLENLNIGVLSRL